MQNLCSSLFLPILLCASAASGFFVNSRLPEEHRSLILFASFGLRAPPNSMSLTVIGLCALSLSAAVYVILDMDRPYEGLFGIPSTSMRNALADIMR
jgi:hypothetical protein